MGATVFIMEWTKTYKNFQQWKFQLQETGLLCEILLTLLLKEGLGSFLGNAIIRKTVLKVGIGQTFYGFMIDGIQKEAVLVHAL